jgi:hypothetical protein
LTSYWPVWIRLSIWKEKYSGAPLFANRVFASSCNSKNDLVPRSIFILFAVFRRDTQCTHSQLRLNKATLFFPISALIQVFLSAYLVSGFLQLYAFCWCIWFLERSWALCWRLSCVHTCKKAEHEMCLPEKMGIREALHRHEFQGCGPKVQCDWISNKVFLT